MYRNVLSATMIGLECEIIHVEADVSDGMPMFDMVGFLGCEVREARERVHTALRNSSMALPPKRITINLSPADVKKEGAAFDLPIAIGILSALELVPQETLSQTLIIGELSLNGEVQIVRGILPIVMAAKEQGICRCILPKGNEREGALVEGMQIIGVASLTEAVEWLNGRQQKRDVLPSMGQAFLKEEEYREDFADLRGQEVVKRGVQIAAAGFHNLLMVGPPGAGKTMIAKRIPTILPPLNIEESLQISKIYSVAGLLPKEDPLIRKRPFRAPHHTITGAALAGGGKYPRPGEISLATRGVLFLDEFTEFSSSTLDLMRQPLEDRKVVLSRLGGTYVYPADFMLVAAMNPCKCGYYPDRSKCTCSPGEINRYLGRVSQPLLDRMDVCVETPRVKYEQLAGERTGESSAKIRERVMLAKERQTRRYQGTAYRFNAELPGSQMKTYCPLGNDQEDLLKQAFESLNLSARAYHRIIKVSRTIADLEGCEQIQSAHIAEAIGYRSMDKKYWS